jgi:hypothetical protein
MPRRLLSAFLISAALTGAANSAVSAQSEAVASEAAALSGKVPTEYYQRATALFQDGKKDDAVFLFYLGQMRYWTHLQAHPGDGDAAQFASLSDSIGQPLNQYAFGDVPAFARTLDAVLAYDETHPDPLTPPSEYPEAHAKVRSSLQSLKQTILADAERIRSLRAKQGLENRN